MKPTPIENNGKKQMMHLACMPQGRSPDRKPAIIVMQEMMVQGDWVGPLHLYPYVSYRRETTRRRYCDTREEAVAWLEDQLQKSLSDLKRQLGRAQKDLVDFKTSIALDDVR